MKFSESDPFNEPDEESGDLIDNLAYNYVECLNYWKSSLRASISSQTLDDCRFTGSELDLDRRGYIKL